MNERFIEGFKKLRYQLAVGIILSRPCTCSLNVYAALYVLYIGMLCGNISFYEIFPLYGFI